MFAPDTPSILMHSCGELVGYLGPIWLAQDRNVHRHAGDLVSFLYDTLADAMATTELAVQKMPRLVKLKKLNEVFVRSRLPSEFSKPLDTRADLYEDISYRMIL
jgi:hypothetical protein